MIEELKIVDKINEFSNKRRKLIEDGEKLLKQERIEFGVEKFYDLDELEYPGVRRDALKILREHGKQLIVKREFYKEFHRSSLVELDELLSTESEAERNRLYSKIASGFEENNELRVRATDLGIEQNNKIIQLVNIYNECQYLPKYGSTILGTRQLEIEAEQICEELDSLRWRLKFVEAQRRQLDIRRRKYIMKLYGFLERLLGRSA